MSEREGASEAKKKVVKQKLGQESSQIRGGEGMLESPNSSGY